MNQVRELSMDELEIVSGGAGTTVVSFTFVRIDTPKGVLTLETGKGADGVTISTANWYPK